MTEFRPGRFEILPLIIKNLLIINVLFFLAQKTIGTGAFNMLDILALHHVKSPLFQPWQLVTHMFLHADMWHLFGNMFGLWMFGSVIENLWGPKRFLTFYFICGIGAALLHLAFLWYDYNDLLNQYVALRQHPSPERVVKFFNEHNLQRVSGSAMTVQSYLNNPYNGELLGNVMNLITDFTYARISFPTLGASGAVFGVLAAFFYLFPNTNIYLYLLFPIKAKWFIGLFYFLPEVFSAIANNPGDSVARWAHIGGALVGFILVLTWNKSNRRKFY